MSFDIKKLLFFIAFLLMIFYFFQEMFDRAYIAALGLFCFIFIYMVVLFFYKKWHSHIFSDLISGCVQSVDPKVAIGIEPCVRGVLVFNGVRLFSRVAVNPDGIFIYKQNAYSFFFSWDSIFLRKKIVGKSTAVVLTLKNNEQCSFVIPWSMSFECYKKLDGF